MKKFYSLILFSFLFSSNAISQTITHLTDFNSYQGTMNLPISIYGNNTSFSTGTNSVIRFRQGTNTNNFLQVTNATIYSGGVAHALITIPYDAPTGLYSVDVYDASQGGFLTKENCFEVLPAATLPLLNGTTPNASSITQTLPVTIFVTQAHFAQATDNVMYLSQGTNYLYPEPGTLHAIGDHYMQADFDMSQLPVAAGTYVTATCGNSHDGVFDDIDAIFMTPSTSISGTIDYSGSDFDGEVELYQRIQTTPLPDLYTKVAAIDVNSMPYDYTFDDIAEADYILRANPLSTNSLVATYYPNVLTWQSATTVTSTVAGLTGVNIIPAASFSLNGTGTVSGAIGFGPNGFKSQVIYEEDVEVFLKDDNGGTYAQTLTNATGDYVFTNVPYGDYSIVINMPGYDQVSTYTFTLSAADDQEDELNFYIEENEVMAFASLSTNEFEVSDFLVYPNPTNGIFNIRMTKDNNRVETLVINQLGEVVFRKSIGDVHQGQSVELNIAEYPAGVYFVRINSDAGDSYARILKTK